MDIGFLYPGYSAEDDYPTARKLLAEGAGPEGGPTPALRVAHTEMAVDAHRVDALRRIGADQVLADGARELGQVSSVPPSDGWARDVESPERSALLGKAVPVSTSEESP